MMMNAVEAKVLFALTDTQFGNKTFCFFCERKTHRRKFNSTKDHLGLPQTPPNDTSI